MALSIQLSARLFARQNETEVRLPQGRIETNRCQLVGGNGREEGFLPITGSTSFGTATVKCGIESVASTILPFASTSDVPLSEAMEDCMACAD